MAPIVKAISVISLAFFASLILGEATSSSPAKTKPRPAVIGVGESPVVVAGRGFARGERVTVRAAVEARRYVRVVRANAQGRFAARFETVNAECLPFQVSAVGRSGRTAAHRRIQIPPPCGVVPQP